MKLFITKKEIPTKKQKTEETQKQTEPLDLIDNFSSGMKLFMVKQPTNAPFEKSATVEEFKNQNELEQKLDTINETEGEYKSLTNNREALNTQKEALPPITRKSQMSIFADQEIAPVQGTSLMELLKNLKNKRMNKKTGAYKSKALERDDIDIGFEQKFKMEEQKLPNDDNLKLPDIFSSPKKNL